MSELDTKYIKPEEARDVAIRRMTKVINGTAKWRGAKDEDEEEARFLVDDLILAAVHEIEKRNQNRRVMPFSVAVMRALNTIEMNGIIAYARISHESADYITVEFALLVNDPLKVVVPVPKRAWFSNEEINIMANEIMVQAVLSAVDNGV